MDAYKTLEWAAKMALVVLIVAVIVIILSLLVPNMDAPGLRADTIAGRVVYNGGLSDQAGIILEERFTQETADKFIFLDSDIPIQVGVKAFLELQGGEVGPINYNSKGSKILSPQANAGLKGIVKDTYKLPVTVQRTDGTLELGFIRLEVLHVE